MKENREHTKATIYTIVTTVVVVLLLVFFGFRTLIPNSEEGILVDFGDSMTGSGMKEPSATVVKPASKPKAPEVAASASKPQASVDVKETVETQDFDDAPVVESGKRKQETEEEKAVKAEELLKKQIAEEKERKRLEAEALAKKKQEEIERKKREEAERLEKERLERERKAAEIRARTQNAFGGGAGDSKSNSQGNTEGSGNQGSSNGAAGAGTYNGSGLGTNGSGFDLKGRSLSGALPQPSYTIQEEGTVVIQIEVDRSGRVVSATPILKGSTTQNPELQRGAREAALKARFNDNPLAPLKQIGTITYHYRLD